jgi:hypothetical protein
LESAFEIYLRTGRRVSPEAASLETKFNPWHDPEDGRFTFAGQGRYFPGRSRSDVAQGSSGVRGRGGRYGGGGASGSWETKPPSKPKPVHSKAPQESTPVPPSAPLQAAPRPEPRVQIPSNGYNFSIDAHARPRQIAGELRDAPQPRSRSAQANAGKPDRRSTDDGGHFIAARFNGPREWFNHFAQDASFNRGEYRALEDKWAKAIRSGKRVFVDIVHHYRGTSMRPHRISVSWVIDGESYSREFPNEKRGK